MFWCSDKNITRNTTKKSRFSGSDMCQKREFVRSKNVPPENEIIWSRPFQPNFQQQKQIFLYRNIFGTSDLFQVMSIHMMHILRLGEFLRTWNIWCPKWNQNVFFIFSQTLSTHLVRKTEFWKKYFLKIFLGVTDLHNNQQHFFQQNVQKRKNKSCFIPL